MNTHTHRGHCQVCLRVIAIDTESGKLALHGYNVKGHQFIGVCSGSERLSLHVERIYTDNLIMQQRDIAAELRFEIEELRSGELIPPYAWKGTMSAFKRWEGVYHKVPAPTRTRPNATADERTMIAWADASVEEHARQLVEEIGTRELSERRALDWANEMTYWANRVHGKVDAYRVKDLDAREWEVGDTVRIGGKKGFDAVIEAVEDRPYRTTGFRQGSRSIMCPHARITQPAVTEKRVSEAAGGYVTRDARPERVVWEALRNIKRPPNALAAELKKAGKL